MKVTITDTPQRLSDIINNSQKSQIKNAVDGEGYYAITIFNPEGGETVYKR